MTAAFEVKMDPRVKATPAELQKKFELELALSRAITSSGRATLQARSLREQSRALNAKASPEIKTALKAFEDALGKALETDEATKAVGVQTLNGNANTLYGMIWGVDAGPTAVQTSLSQGLVRDLPAALKRWEDFKSAELTKINAQLKAAGLAELKLQANPEPGEDEGNEE
jgi:hypothetical protein